MERTKTYQRMHGANHDLPLLKRLTRSDQEPGVALTSEKLRIANAQHGKNCVSNPAAKATISTDLRKIDKHENTNV